MKISVLGIDLGKNVFHLFGAVEISHCNAGRTIYEIFWFKILGREGAEDDPKKATQSFIRPGPLQISIETAVLLD